MEPVDEGLAYMDIMSWLLSPSGKTDEDEGMVDRMGELVVGLRLDLLDGLLRAVMGCERLWKAGMEGEGRLVIRMFLKFKAGCRMRMLMPSLTPANITFIRRWRDLVASAQDRNQFYLRQLCLLSAVLVSTTSCPRRLKKTLEQDCLKFMRLSIIQPPSLTPAGHQADSRITTWLAAQTIPSIHPSTLSQAPTNDIITCLANSLFGLFEDGNLFSELSISLASSPHSVQLLPSSSTEMNLKRVSSNPLAQIVLSISLSISQLMENASGGADVKSFQAHLDRLAQITRTVHETWRAATGSLDQAVLAQLEDNSTTLVTEKLTKTEENQSDKWLRNIFFSSLLIVGGLLNKLVAVECPDGLLTSLLRESFKILQHIHFIALRLTSDQLSTYHAVFDCLILLSKPFKPLVDTILKEVQPALTDPQNIKDPVRISDLIYYLNLVERYTGEAIAGEYLDRIVVPILWTLITNNTHSKVRRQAHLSLFTVLEASSRQTVVEIADKSFELLIQDVLLDEESSLLSFEQQETGWVRLLRAVWKHSKPQAEALVSKLSGMIASIQPARTGDTGTSSRADHQHGGEKQKNGERRARLFKLLISQIGEVAADDPTRAPVELERDLDRCWALAAGQADLVDLFVRGLNKQSLKLPHAHTHAVRWWLSKTTKLMSAKL